MADKLIWARRIGKIIIDIRKLKFSKRQTYPIAPFTLQIPH
jgi:hypothetical protein